MKISDISIPFILPKSGSVREAGVSGNAHSPVSVADTSGIQRTDSAIQPVNQVSDVQAANASRLGEKNADMDRQVDDAIEKANQFFQDGNRSLQFVKDKDSDKIVIMIKDLKTDEVIRQIPSESMLKLSKQLEQLQGILFEEKA